MRIQSSLQKYVDRNPDFDNSLALPYIARDLIATLFSPPCFFVPNGARLFEDVATFKQKQASDNTRVVRLCLEADELPFASGHFKVSGTIHQELL